jgi:hypothetical protein
MIHQVFIGGRAGGLNDKHIASAHVFRDLDRDLTIRETPHSGAAELDAQMCSDFLCHDRIGVAGEDHEIGVWLGHVRAPCSQVCGRVNV